MFERILEQNCQTFDNFNFEFSMSHHNAHYQSYKKAPGKGTDMATPLGPEIYGRIDFSLGRWTTMGQNAPKLELNHAKEQVELVRIFLRSLLRPQESLF